ncbi:hypothetical protein BDN70DRAFT_998435 [Pholiota conissans]|uniref:CUE domain-containing protein n=1 Tax=Pholiota conissans TaxID=109636 RepID=A0A9P6CML9_9AGAR|nr:hypothetical protein BDN70DRAFT_998435 [Pholiota conissans]
MTNNVLRLPAYPSTPSRKALSASQRASLNQNIASTLGTVLALPPQKRDTQSTRNFLSTYARDTAVQTLQSLIWQDEADDNASGPPRTADEKLIQKRSLLLAEKLAQTAPGLDIQILLDLSIIYARTQPAHLHLVFKAAAAESSASPPLSQIVASDLVPGFTTLLAQQTPASQGLYAQRKVAECVFAFLRGAKGTPDLIRPFAHSKQFVITLASLYDVGMSAIAASYGGIPALSAGISGEGREADEWEKIWVETKVALLDAFHIALSVLIDDLAACPQGPRLAAEAERTFDIIFALLEAPSSSSTTELIPFLNQSLLADYQQSYSLSKTLASALKHAQEKDARLDLLESSLQSLNTSEVSTDRSSNKKAGALKILLRSSGIQPGIDNLGTRNSRPQESVAPPPSLPDLKGKGKSRGAPPPAALSDPDLDIKATQVLDILPDTPVNHVKLLLAHDRYGRNPEKVIEALLEGTAMSEEELAQDFGQAEDVDYAELAAPKQTYDVSQRRNVFDDEDLDLSRLRLGKQAADNEVLRDRTFIEQMKADILRRAEAISDEEEEVDESEIFGTGAKGKGKAKDTDDIPRAVDLGPDEDEDDIVHLRVAGDGEDSGDSDEDEEAEEQEGEQTPDTILELAYLRDPKIFDRDAATRRSKAREDLKAQTGMDNEQIEGWKVMLERDPRRKAKIEEKHAFRGNEKGLNLSAASGGGARGGRGRGRGGPRGGRGRGGGGGGGRGGGAGGGESSARERAWKDKNKASRGNHNRKRGHDKKMARAGAVAGPST